jgi:hypothetical protein
VWAIGEPDPEFGSGEGGLFRIDPATNTVDAALPMAGAAVLVGHEDRLWVAPLFAGDLKEIKIDAR